jgi:NAD(P)-dependent dehydrogenase (short-subunit alcohol dehydrogenase family)
VSSGEETRRGRLAGRRAIVTGAAGGIGAALARGVAREGAMVACVDMAGAVEGVAASIGESGGEAIPVVADLTDLDQVERMHATASDALGGVDLLVANAGGSRGEMIPFLELEPDAWRNMIDRNLTSVYYCSLVCARQMAAQGGGSIVVTSSQLSEVARPGMGHYAAAKGGVRQLVKAMAVDLAPYGIRVNAMAPGPTLTPGNRAMFERPEVAEANLRTIPLGRVAEPEEMVGAVVYLASDEASFTTGATVFVDGGYTIL